MSRRILMLGYPVWDTSRDAEPTLQPRVTDPVSDAGRTLALARETTLRERRAAMRAQLEAERGPL